MRDHQLFMNFSIFSRWSTHGYPAIESLVTSALDLTERRIVFWIWKPVTGVASAAEPNGAPSCHGATTSWGKWLWTSQQFELGEIHIGSWVWPVWAGMTVCIGVAYFCAVANVRTGFKNSQFKWFSLKCWCYLVLPIQTYIMGDPYS